MYLVLVMVGVCERKCMYREKNFCFL